MHDDYLRIRESLASLQSAMNLFTAGNRERLFQSRDLLRKLGDDVSSSPWEYTSPICEVVQRLLGNVLRHGGLTEEDSIEVAGELLSFIDDLLERPAPGIGQTRIVHNPVPTNNPTQAGAEPVPQAADYEPKGTPIKLSLGMIEESRLGEILIRSGKLTLDQLHQALALQQVCRKRLGEVLISLNLIDDMGLNVALTEQRRMTLQMATDVAAHAGGLELNIADGSVPDGG